MVRLCRWKPLENLPIGKESNGGIYTTYIYPRRWNGIPMGIEYSTPFVQNGASLRVSLLENG